MAKKHDERKDLRSVSRVARINGNHIIIGDKSAVGIHTWGKIDFLTKYCGYVATYEHGVKASNLKLENQYLINLILLQEKLKRFVKNIN